MEDHSLKAVAGRLRQVADLFVSREDAAAAAGVSRPQLSRYLNGTTKIPLIVAARLAEAHGISVDWIASGRGEMLGDSVSGTEQARMTRLGQYIDRHLERDGLSLPADRRSDLVRAIAAMENRDPVGEDNDIDIDRYAEVIRLVAKG